MALLFLQDVAVVSANSALWLRNVLGEVATDPSGFVEASAVYTGADGGTLSELLFADVDGDGDMVRANPWAWGRGRAPDCGLAAPCGSGAPDSLALLCV
jgi:hypothetical protein